MITTALLFALFIAFSLWIRKQGHRDHRLPPGPPTQTILGNLLAFPKSFAFLQLSQWAIEYGDVYSLKLLNTTMIVLTSGRAVKEVLDKLGLHTGNRPKPYVFSMAEGTYVPLENMDSHVWKSSRKAAHSFLTSEKLASYWPMQQVQYSRLMHAILGSPNAVCDHLKAASVHIMSSLVYGIPTVDLQGERWRLYYEGIRRNSELSDPFAQPPSFVIPILKYIPTRFLKWKQLCVEYKAIRASFFDDLNKHSEESFRKDLNVGGYLEQIMRHPTQCDMSMDELRWVNALVTMLLRRSQSVEDRAFGRVLMDGGIETSAAFLQSFVLALTCHPKHQKRVQEEVDAVIGSDRLPSLDDYERLPYLRAFVKEVHRYRPVLPAAIPHVATKDINYNGSLIPKDAIIILNTCSECAGGIFHDPELYDEPEVFNPERYLHHELGVKPSANVDGLRDSLPFGAGRRICPGAEMATRNIAMTTMNLVWGFTFADKEGNCSMDIQDYHNGAEIVPKAFHCDVNVRSANHARLIEASFAHASSA
ncbi:hypothetical protein ONZ45_g7403 [Pleurotus djamor]|nr:hypothetical protein ONZ45_g7403 [Pleurotus djamor]